MNKSPVESFDLDHTKVAAPYIRLATTVPGEHGDIIYKYDVRFKQPNKAYMEMKGLHSIEHLMAYNIRTHLPEVVDISPMGCQTGFYVTILNNKNWHAFADAFAKTLNDVLAANEVPACNIYQCGWAANHSLEDAKTIAKEMLACREQWDKVFQ